MLINLLVAAPPNDIHVPPSTLYSRADGLFVDTLKFAVFEPAIASGLDVIVIVGGIVSITTGGGGVYTVIFVAFMDPTPDPELAIKPVFDAAPPDVAINPELPRDCMVPDPADDIPDVPPIVPLVGFPVVPPDVPELLPDEPLAEAPVLPSDEPLAVPPEDCPEPVADVELPDDPPESLPEDDPEPLPEDCAVLPESEPPDDEPPPVDCDVLPDV